MKENKLSTLTITEDAGERQVQDIFSGKIVTQKLFHKYIAEQEISLGSIINPNKKIKEFSYDIPSQRKSWGLR